MTELFVKSGWKWINNLITCRIRPSQSIIRCNRAVRSTTVGIAKKISSSRFTNQGVPLLEYPKSLLPSTVNCPSVYSFKTIILIKIIIKQIFLHPTRHHCEKSASRLVNCHKFFSVYKDDLAFLCKYSSFIDILPPRLIVAICHSVETTE